MTARLRKSTGNSVYGYGHIGDGNLHINMISNNETMKWHDSELF